MIQGAHLIEVLGPVAPSILEADAQAIALVVSRKGTYAGWDRQPAAAAAAGERRAAVATRMRGFMGDFDWALKTDNFLAGAYEWVKDGVAVRLSKTTPQSRQEEAAALLGVQVPMFETTADPAGEPDTVLIRLMGSAFGGSARIDVMPLGNDGRKTYATSLQAIARANTERFARTGDAPESDVALPDVALPKARGTDDSE